MSLSLSKYAFFKSFDERELTLLESVMQERNLEQGAFLFRKGEKLDLSRFK